MRSAFIALVLAGATSCTIILKPPPPPPPVVGLSDLCNAELTAEMPVAHILLSARVDRTVVGLSEHYGRWMRKAALGMFAAGVRPGRVVLFRADERPVSEAPLAAWGCDLGGYDVPPERVIEHYASAEPPPSSPIGCAVDPLVRAGARLADIVTSYPPEIEAQSGLRVFGDAPDLVVVVHIDSLARKSGLEETACAGARTLAQASGDSAAWLSYPGGIDMARVRHWFIATDEGIDRPTFVDRCRRVEGFPTGVLDVLEPSAKLLYSPLARAVREASGAASDISLCPMLSPSKEAEFLDAELHDIASDLGTTPNEPFLEQVLAGDGSVGEPAGPARATDGG